MTNVITQSFSGFNLTAFVESRIANIRAARAQRAKFDRTYAELQQMTDRELVEFGLYRSDLADLARDHVAAV